MEMKSPPPCPATITVRRNPPRKARATPSSAIPLRKQLSSPSLSRNIFSIETLQNPNRTDDDTSTDSSTRNPSENLKVFLRIRPLTVQKISRNIAESKNAWPKNPKIKVISRPKAKKSCEICVEVNEDMRSVTVSTPKQLQEMKRIKSEIYEGFSHVFASGASQTDVYEQMVKPLVEDFLRGKSGMLAAMGPSGSGKTHTVFGSAREPGMVPLAIRRIFSENENPATHTSRVFYLSMFEISSEKGKAERMTDLLHDRGDISMQQSVIKGLKEAAVSDAQQAESLIAHGMLRRATATTNSNTQSSRSQCIINIRRDSTQVGEVDVNASSSMLTIVDLAGAEREKKTGNQGARLLESNFINNTSMVFGQCLRSLLEHQRNRNKPLPKHYKNSLLTRYLQDYLEGKKRMALILTVKPGVEEYLDTSFLLRQTSPFTRIKFKTVEEPINLTCNKRPNQALPQAGQLKKLKFTNSEASLIDEGSIERGHDLTVQKEITTKEIKGLNNDIEEAHDANINEVHVLSNEFVGVGIQAKSSLKGNHCKPNVKKDREYQIMQGLSKAMLTVLKQYREKIEGLETENCRLRDSLENEKTRSLDLENELTREKISLFDLENELKELKSRCTCGKASSDVFPVSMHDASLNPSQHQMADLVEANTENISCSSRELEKTENEKKTDSSQLEDPLQSSDDTTSSNSSEELNFHDYMVTVDMPSGSRATSQPTSGFLFTSHKTEQNAVNIVGDVKNLEQESECVSNGHCFATSLECGSANSSQDYEDPKDAKQYMPTQFMPYRSQASSCSTSGSCMNHNSDQDAEEIVGGVDNLEPRIECASTGSPFDISLECEESTKSIVDSEDLKDAKEEETEFQKNGVTGSKVAAEIVGGVDNLEPESECASTGSSFDTSLECEESTKSIVGSEDLKDAKQEQTQFQKNGVTEIVGGVDNFEPESACATGSSFDTSLECEESTKSIVDSEGLKDAKQEQTQFQTNGATAHSDTAPNSSESPLKDETCYHMDEAQCKNEGGKQEPLDTGLPEEGLNAKGRPKFVPIVAPCSNFQLAGKPKRRLQPVSSVLLKDLSFLSIKDENDKPKGGRVGKKGTTEDKTRTQGSLSLLNLLTSKT